MKRSCFIFFVLLTILSCTDEPAKLKSVDFVNTTEISISIDKDSVAANGISRAMISINALHKSLYDQTVTLKIFPVGKLTKSDGSGESQTISIKFSSTGNATAFLTSATSGLAIINATIDNLPSIPTASTQLKFFSPRITATFESDSVPADNKTFKKIEVKAGKDWAGKNVKIEIFPVGFLKDPTNSASTVNVLTLPLSNDGSQVANFGSSSAGLSNIRITIEGQTSLHAVNFYNSSPYTIQLANDNLMADNYSVAIISFVAEQQVVQGKTITFTTDNGTFSNGQQSYTTGADVDGVGKAYLKSTKAETARITITFPDNATKEQLVKFMPALPTSILVDPGVSTLPSELTSNTTVTANVVRYPGNPSDNQVVVFSDSTEVNTSIGTFLNVTSTGTTKQASAKYWVQNASYSGFVYIKACVVKSDGTSICGKNRILIN